VSLIISIDCQSGNAGGEQREARVETTATGVKWTISGKLEEAVRELFVGIGERCAKKIIATPIPDYGSQDEYFAAKTALMAAADIVRSGAE